MGTRNSKQSRFEQVTRSTFCLTALMALGACTQQTPETFRITPAEETFAAGGTPDEVHEVAREVLVEEVVETTRPAQIDILWVIDNSSSMEPSQDKLRKGFRKFAEKYMKPEYDIRTAVITTDTFLAHPAFRKWREAKEPGMGLARKDINPAIGPNYARLLPGIHDGPIAGLCSEKNKYFFHGYSNCSVRESSRANRGVENCINPREGEKAVEQCVNTLSNDTVHSGKPILSTKTASSTEELIRDFLVNASTGAAGFGLERGMGSVLQLLKDNESTDTALFRKGSFRVIIFLADEDDQTQPVPAEGDANPLANYDYRCPSRTIEGVKHDPLGRCVKQSKLMKVEKVKETLDAFFARLDGEASKPSYMIASIVGKKSQTIKALQADLKAKLPWAEVSHDEGKRYMKLAELVGNGSESYDIGEEDYSPILDKIGKTVIERSIKYRPETRREKVTKPGVAPNRTMVLKREPTSSEEMIVTLVRENGSTQTLGRSQYVLNGKNLTLTDEGLIQSLKPKDRLVIKYQPKTIQ